MTNHEYEIYDEIPGSPKSTKWHELAAVARANPGKWVKNKELSSNSGVTSAIKRGKLAAFRPAGAFESSTRSLGSDGVLALYVRFVGSAAAND